MNKQSVAGRHVAWLGYALVAAVIVLGASLYEVNRKAASNVGRIDALVAQVDSELKTAQGRIASLESIRALAAAQSADLESKYQALVARVDAAAMGVGGGAYNLISGWVW